MIIYIYTFILVFASFRVFLYLRGLFLLVTIFGFGSKMVPMFMVGGGLLS